MRPGIAYDRILARHDGRKINLNRSDLHAELCAAPREMRRIGARNQGLGRRAASVDASPAARIGFDWETVDGIFEKMREEVAELQVALEAASKNKTNTVSDEDVEAELGDILFVAVNLARFLKFDPEVALKKSNLKFKSRFQLMECETMQSGQSLSSLSKDKLEVLWESAKESLRTNPGDKTIS
jgi:uncharacterized protein YabN with tetrapyrrole methylase and pyrophosphatase domain